MLMYQKSKPTARGSHALLLPEKHSHSILIAFGDTQLPHSVLRLYGMWHLYGSHLRISSVSSCTSGDRNLLSKKVGRPLEK